jgi:hypothetical protein
MKFLCPAKNEVLGITVEILLVKRRRVHGVEELFDIAQVQLDVMHAWNLPRQQRRPGELFEIPGSASLQGYCLAFHLRETGVEMFGRFELF